MAGFVVVNMYIANSVSWFQYPEMHKVLKIEVKDSREQIIIKSKHYHYKSHEQKDEKKMTRINVVKFEFGGWG